MQGCFGKLQLHDCLSSALLNWHSEKAPLSFSQLSFRNREKTYFSDSCGSEYAEPKVKDCIGWR